MKKNIVIVFTLIVIFLIMFKIFSKFNSRDNHSNDDVLFFEHNSKKGIKATGNKVMFEPRFDSIIKLNNSNLAKVCVNTKWGIVNTAQGVGLIPVQYDSIDFQFGSFIVVQNNQYGVIDIQNQIIVPIKYQDIEALGANFLKVKLKKKVGVLSFQNNTLKTVISVDYKHIQSVCNDSFLLVGNENGKFGLYDYSGEQVLPVFYDDLLFIQKHNLLICQNGGKFELFNYLKRKKISNKQYDEFGEFKNKLAIVGYEGKYGMIDINGREIVETNYSFLEPFNNEGFAQFRIGDISGHIKRDDLFKKSN